jgi:hypothetical protein
MFDVTTGTVWAGIDIPYLETWNGRTEREKVVVAFIDGSFVDLCADL